MSSANMPLLVMVPGGFGTPDGFDKLVPYLEGAGFSTTPGAYPSCDPEDPTTATCPNDVAALRRDVLLPLVEEQQRDVVIIAHSFGGVVGGGAAKGLDKTSRSARGQGGGVVGLIYVVGNIHLEGESLIDAVGGAYPPFVKLNKPSPGLAVLEPAMEILYNDCDAGLAPELESYMRPHASLTFETKATAPAWADPGFDGRRAYVRTLADRCLPRTLQDAWLEKSKVKWEVVDFDSGHMPFVSQPEALARQIEKFIKGFLAV